MCREEDAHPPAENEPRRPINETELSVQTARHFDNRKQAAIRIDLKLLISEPRFGTTKERSRKSQKCGGAPTWNIATMWRQSRALARGAPHHFRVLRCLFFCALRRS